MRYSNKVHLDSKPLPMYSAWRSKTHRWTHLRPSAFDWSIFAFYSQIPFWLLSSHFRYTKRLFADPKKRAKKNLSILFFIISTKNIFHILFATQYILWKHSVCLHFAFQKPWISRRFCSQFSVACWIWAHNYQVLSETKINTKNKKY